MNLLFTGASGFLGKNIQPLLEEYYQVFTEGLSSSCDYAVDLSKEIPSFRERYDVVLHAAGKAHVIPKSKAEEQSFFDVNLQGTKNLCAGLEKSGIPKSFIFISTVAVYGCECGNDITEMHPLQGSTPYALSKIEAEKFLRQWCESHHVVLGIIRPSLIAGPNPPGNLGAMLHGLARGGYLSIAGGKAQKSVLMVQDIAKLVPLLAEKGGVYNVCDDSQPSFRDLETIICKQLNRPLPLVIPLGFAKILALMGDCLGKKAPINSLKLNKMTKSLTFSNMKAKKELNWQPMSVLENFKIS